MTKPKQKKDDKPRKTWSRQKKEVDVDLLRKIAAVNCSYEEMGGILECSSDTLSRHYKKEIDQERAKGYASLRKSQFKYALRGNASLLIFLGKVYLKQRPEEEGTGETINVIINDTHIAQVKKNGKKESVEGENGE